jgi:hypothetical protein
MATRKKKADDGELVPIHVLALNNVLGMQSGQTAMVFPTREVEVLINAGHLKWLDDPSQGDEPTVAAAEEVEVSQEVPVEEPAAP